MFKCLNKVMSSFFEFPSSLDNHHANTLCFAWLGSAFLFGKVFMYELILLWTETIMIFTWFGRVFVDVYCLRPARANRDVSEKVMWFLSVAFQFVVILIVLGNCCFITFTLLKCIKDIVLWVNLLGAITMASLKYCRTVISFVTTVVVVAHSMYAFRAVAHSIRRMFWISTLWLEYPDQHFTINSLMRCSIFVYAIVWATNMFSLIYIPGLVIFINCLIL